MLKKFFQAFRPPQPPALPDPDAELALGALMVRVAQSDREYQLPFVPRQKTQVAGSPLAAGAFWGSETKSDA